MALLRACLYSSPLLRNHHAKQTLKGETTRFDLVSRNPNVIGWDEQGFWFTAIEKYV